MRIAFAAGEIELVAHANRGDAPMRISCIAALLALASANSACAFVQTKFSSEETARQRCPIDMVVWLTLPGNSFVVKGDPRFGTTQRGAYMCERDAIAAGNRAAH
jgi:hypothetical protein